MNIIYLHTYWHTFNNYIKFSYFYIYNKLWKKYILNIHIFRCLIIILISIKDIKAKTTIFFVKFNVWIIHK